MTVISTDLPCLILAGGLGGWREVRGVQRVMAGTREIHPKEPRAAAALLWLERDSFTVAQGAGGRARLQLQLTALS